MKAEEQLPLDFLDQKLTSEDSTTLLLKERQITNLRKLLSYIRALPYGRNSNRQDLSLVIKENKGTCSSKHACVKMLMDLNEIKEVQLILCLYKMNERNTPGIGPHIKENNLSYIPEAHCYLQIKDQKIDLTKTDSNLSTIKNDILEEIKINPEQITDFKVEYHKKYLKKWIAKNDIPKDFKAIWEIREACIQELSNV